MQKVGPRRWLEPEGVEQRSVGRRGHWVRRSLRCTAGDNRKAPAIRNKRVEDRGASMGALSVVGSETGPGAFEDSRHSLLLETGSEHQRSLIPRYRLGQGSRYIDHFSISRLDNADRLASKYRVDYLSTHRLTELQNSRDSGSYIFY